MRSIISLSPNLTRSLSVTFSNTNPINTQRNMTYQRECLLVLFYALNWAYIFESRIRNLHASNLKTSNLSCPLAR